MQPKDFSKRKFKMIPGADYSDGPISKYGTFGNMMKTKMVKRNKDIADAVPGGFDAEGNWKADVDDSYILGATDAASPVMGITKATKRIADNMFKIDNPFKELVRDPKYFLRNKKGLKSKVVDMPPENYIAAVEARQPDHKRYGAEQDKLDKLRKTYEEGTLVDMPMLAYGGRDFPSDDFQQEGYHRARTAYDAGKRSMPVAIRYRDGDKNIPNYIQDSLDMTASVTTNLGTE